MVRKLLIAIVIVLILSIASFFVFSQMSSPKTPATYLPKNEINSPRVNAMAGSEDAVTLFMLKENKVYAYEGKNRNAGKVWNLSSIGELLSKEKQKKGDSVTVIIKPSRFGTYNNTVDLLDKITQNDIKNYVLLDVSKDEEEFIEQKQHEVSK